MVKKRLLFFFNKKGFELTTEMLMWVLFVSGLLFLVYASIIIIAGKTGLR